MSMRLGQHSFVSLLLLSLTADTKPVYDKVIPRSDLLHRLFLLVNLLHQFHHLDLMFAHPCHISGKLYISLIFFGDLMTLTFDYSEHLREKSLL